MASQLIILAAAFAVSNAGPVWIDSEYVPGVFLRTGRSPSVAFGFGSGFSSNIGGISHSTGISSSYQSGDAQAYGSGVAGTNGNVFARGVGYANAAPSYPFNHQPAVATFPFNSGLSRSWAYVPTTAVASAQNFGNFGSAVSSASSHGGFGSAASAVHNQGLGRTQSAVSSAQNFGGYGSAASSASNGLRSAVSTAQNVGDYRSAASSASNGLRSAVSTAQNIGDYRSAVSSVQGHNGFGNYGTAVSAAQDFGGYRASTAQTSQQRGLGFQNSGASSINGPGIQAAQSHAVNTF